MRISTLVTGLAVVVMTTPAVMAQQSLGDVAGSIKLKRPEGEAVVIDQNAVGTMRRRGAAVSEGDYFREILGDCVTETRALHELLVEVRDGEGFYQNEWRDRVQEAGLRLDSALDDVALVRVEDRYRGAFELAEYGVVTAADALEIVRGAIADNRPVFSESRRLTDEAIRAFEEAQGAIAVASRAAAAEQPAPPINPIEANGVISSLCGGRYEAGSSGYESCLAGQRAAIDTMAGRSPASVGLDPMSFNVIRNNCRFEYSNNFVNQDQCELRRIAAKRSR